VGSRVTTRLAVAMWLASVAASISGIVVASDTPRALVFVLQLAPVGLTYATVGALVSGRRPANPVGWLFAGWGLAMNGLSLAQAYVDHAVANPGALPGVEWAGWIMAVAWHPCFAFLAFQLLLFPYGDLPSPRWRHFARATVAVYALLALSAAFAPSAPALYTGGLDPPFTTPAGQLADMLFDFLLSFQLAFVAVSMVSLVLRLRRARGRERQQIKGFVSAVVVAVTAFIAGIFVFDGGVLFPVFGIIPVAAGVAILRQQLYDIDRVINRTVVYGLLSAVLALIYAAGVLGFGQIFGRASDLAVAGSTLAVAALFQPVRRRVQQTVDRRFNRRRYDAARLVTAFSQRCRDQVELDTIATDLASVVAQSVEPAHLSLWWHPAAQDPAAVPSR
jgi:hypothetical protein